jgi:nucleotide-binding universal stress UspA family protein
MLGGIHGFLALIDIDEGHYASRVAPELTGAVGAAEHSVASLARIVVPVVDTVSSERAAEMACRLGAPQQAEIVLVHVVEVPLTQALGDAGGPERDRAEKALHLGQAIVGRHGMRSRTRLLFERSAGSGIVRVAKEEGADVIVMARGEKRQTVPTEMSPTMRDVLRHAPCEVLIDQAPGVSR